MKFSINPTYICKRPNGAPGRSIPEVFKKCMQHGFQEFDFTPNVTVDGWEEKTGELAYQLKEMGAWVHQTHAPFNRYNVKAGKEGYKQYEENFMKVIKASHILGAKYVVVHADEFYSYDYDKERMFDADEAFEFSRKFYVPFAEYAADLGLTIAFETVFEDCCLTSKCRSRYTSYVEELLAVIDAYSQYNAVCCWDSGHAHVQYGKDDMTVLERLAPKVACTHIHDNYYKKDLHLIPYSGEINWESAMQIMKKAGYQGNLSLELVYGAYPDELIDNMLDMAFSAVKKLKKEFDQ